jgi:hypothetical protein
VADKAIELVRDFNGFEQCYSWLRQRFTIVTQYDGKSHHEISARPNPAGFNSTTSDEIDFHNDAYDYELVPPYVALFCACPATSGGETFVSAIDESLATLSAESIRFLSTELVFFATPPARFFRTPNTGVRDVPIRPGSTRFSVSYLRGQSREEDQKHILELRDALRVRRSVYSLRGGDMLLFDNIRYLHSRAAFVGAQRMLHRFWLQS